VGAGGRHALKTYKRTDSKFSPCVHESSASVLVANSDCTRHSQLRATRVVAKNFGRRHAWPANCLGRATHFFATQSWKPIKECRTRCEPSLRLAFRADVAVYWFIATIGAGPDGLTNPEGLEIYQLVLLCAIVIGIGTFARSPRSTRPR